MKKIVVLVLGLVGAGALALSAAGAEPGPAPRREFRASHAEVEALASLNAEMARIQAAYADVERRTRAVFADVRAEHGIEPSARLGYDAKNQDAAVFFVVEEPSPGAPVTSAAPPAPVTTGK